MSVGSLLREQRERLGLDLAEVAAYLRIRLPFLEAIENDAFEQLPPGGAYRVGFIKSYAGALEIDPEKAAAQFRQEQAHANQKQPLTMRRPVGESRVPTFSLVFVVLALFAAGWVGWAYLHRSDRTLAEEVPPVPDRLQEKPAQLEAQAGQPAAPEGRSNNAAAAGPPQPSEPSQPPGPSSVPATAQASPPPPAEGEQDEAHDETYNRDTQAQSPAFHFATADAGASTVPGTALGASGPSRVEVKASADSWVQIRDPSKVAYTGVLHAGDSYRVPDQPGWSLVAGNAGGISLMIDGTEGAPLGKSGQVIRGVSLMPLQGRPAQH